MINYTNKSPPPQYKPNNTSLDTHVLVLDLFLLGLLGEICWWMVKSAAIPRAAPLQERDPMDWEDDKFPKMSEREAVLGGGAVAPLAHCRTVSIQSS